MEEIPRVICVELALEDRVQVAHVGEGPRADPEQRGEDAFLGADDLETAAAVPRCQRQEGQQSGATSSAGW